MFKQLKRKMLVLNLSLLTILLLAVFLTLYLTSYRQIQNQIDNQIVLVMKNYRESVINEGPLPPPQEEDNAFLPDRSVSFIYVTNLSGEVIESWFSFETDDDFSSVTSLVSSDRGQIELNGSYWAYHRDVVGLEVVYGFVDVTNEQAYLSNMIWTFLFVFLGSFVLVYFISNYFSSQSLKKIKEAFNKQKEFIANASHELKTPIAIISTNADILIQEEKENKWLNNIKYETERMSKLTKDLLYLTKMNEDTPREIDFIKANISELVESSVLGFEALAYDKAIELKSDIEPNIYAMVEPNQMSQVFHILMDNAIKYTNQSGLINVSVKVVHHHLIYTIANSGDGISKSDMENIFDRFYMGDKSRSINEKSFGLGLSIAKSIIDHHQGKISCTSEEGELTQFSVKLRVIGD